MATCAGSCWSMGSATDVRWAMWKKREVEQDIEGGQGGKLSKPRPWGGRGILVVGLSPIQTGKAERGSDDSC